ncbi:hypothetical protein BSKO_09356 [Bryopsis sp. KO-2023]|nr:hypothetical protein BSKO_09356 [Bryopsis sp. KO-2023]
MSLTSNGCVRRERGRIVRLEVENFKSYKGRQYVGPFKDFTAVVGPNGSGKSNLMDAISFVLGVQTDQLRGRLVELLYRGLDSNGEVLQSKSGYVKLVFLDPDGVEIQFSRKIVPSGSGPDASYQSQYRIDERLVGRDAYVGKMKQYGVLVKARNFLVFQGDIESVAQMNPSALTTLVEQISGSVELAREYEELKEDVERADNEVRRHHVQKKTINVEKRQVKEQKTQAEQHLALEAELKDCKIMYFQWLAYHADKDITSENEGIEKMREALREVARSQRISEDLLSDLQGKHKEKMDLHMALEQDIRKKERDAERKSPEGTRVHEELKRFKKKFASSKKELHDMLTKRGEQEAHVHSILEELQKVKKLRSELEEVIRKEEEEGKRLSQDDLKEYRRIKTKVSKKTSTLSQHMQGLQCQLSATQDVISRKKDAMGQLEAQNEVAKEQREQNVKKIEEMTATIAGLRTDKKALSTKRGHLSETNRRTDTRRDFCLKKIADLEERINDARVSRIETRRERELLQSLEKLKDAFPGVYGRITDLGKVMQKEHNMAISVAMMKDMDSVVVDTLETGQRCIEFLKRNQLQSITFLPLAGMDVRPLDESLRQLGGTSKLAIDLLEFDRAHVKAFMLALGSTVVCSTLDEAAEVSARHRHRIKVVAMDGTLLDVKGSLTGGHTDKIAARAAQWNEQEVEAWQKELDKHQEELREMAPAREGRQEEQRISIEVENLGRRIRRVEEDIRTCEARLRDKDAEIDLNKKDLEKIRGELPALEKEIEEKQQEIDSVKDQIDKVADRKFADFSRRIGVESYREYEEGHVQRADELSKQKAELSTKEGQLSNQIDYEKSIEWDVPIENLQQKTGRCQKNIAELTKKNEEIEAAKEQILKELEEDRNKLAELKREYEEVMVEIREAKKITQKHHAIGRKMKRDLDNRVAGMEDLKSKREDVVKTASMQLGEEFTPDASCLKRHHTATESEEARERMDKELTTRIDDLNIRLQKTAPNLKAFERYNQVLEQEQGQQSALEKARRAAAEVSQKFHNIHNQRYDLFMEAFNHIDSEINEIYSSLTKSDVHPNGGSANLYLENSKTPFLHGIKFTPIPPGKRYRQVEQLSGGEKTVAALALLFSIHSFHPSPFFVLDEIDATLDASNVSKVVRYIWERTQEGSFQSIVISLKDVFFSWADSLVGVTSDRTGSSKSFTADLGQYPMD